MKISFKSARHGLAYHVVVEATGKSFGIVQRDADGTWMHQWLGGQVKVNGFKTRMDATIGLLLSWGGRGGAPAGAEIYNWALGK